VCKRIINAGCQKQLRIPSKPLLASFSAYSAETQHPQGFYEIKTTDADF